MSQSTVPIKTSIRKEDGKYVVRIQGVTSGFVVHGGDGDNMTIEFKFDASRFSPYFTKE